MFNLYQYKNKVLCFTYRKKLYFLNNLRKIMKKINISSQERVKNKSQISYVTLIFFYFIFSELRSM